jgi:hypothetical protein
VSEKPTLHEIAAMPFPASEQALYKYYGVRPKDGKDGELKTFKVTYHYSVRENYSESYTVEAVDDEQAEKMADDIFDEDRSIPADADVDDVEVVEVKS